MESGLEPPGKVLDGVKEKRQQGVLHLAVELLLDGLGKRTPVFVLECFPDARHLCFKGRSGGGSGRGHGGYKLSGGSPVGGREEEGGGGEMHSVSNNKKRVVVHLERKVR